MSEIEKRLKAVRGRIEEAALRAGRPGADVEIVAVTKGHPASVLRDVAASGLPIIGENRVDEAERKFRELGRLGVRWHMIGHLQRNKARRAVQLFDVIESLDSLRLARKLASEAERAGRKELEVLLEVNVSGEASKGGFSGEALLEAASEITALDRLRVVGLMTMAPYTPDERVLRTVFRRTRELFERCGREVRGFEARTLSMGMSNDFEIAVEEGSTRLRLGTVLIGPRPGEIGEWRSEQTA
jgi:pyridoxal phosphate enzyme (YggS family)